MNPLQRTLLQALAVACLGVLGWDALRPRTDDPASFPVNAPPSLPPSPQNAGTGATPRFTHLATDRILVRGQRLVVHGRVQGLNPAQPATLSLEGPDGSMATAELQEDGSGGSTFSLQHPCTAPAPGSFSWTLRLDPFGDTAVLGVHVAEADPPRVLLLQDHPTVEGARLHRWLRDARSPVTLRTRVSADRYRVASSHAAAGIQERLDARTLASFDIVVAHAAAIDRLSPEEHQILDHAVKREGIGLLILDSSQPSDFGPGENSPSPAQATSPADATPQPNRERPGKSPLVSPWLRKSAPATYATEGSRETRIELANGFRLESPVAVLTEELRIPPDGLVLARDPQGRPLVAQASLGRGRWAYSIVLDTWRWRQHGHPDDHARFWSALLSAVARPAPAASASWSLAEASQPFFVDHRITLNWSGAPDTRPPPAEIRAHGPPAHPAIPLNLDPLPSEPSQGRATYWPEVPGWHQVRALPTGPTLDFYVQPSQALPGIRAQRGSDTARQPPGPANMPNPVERPSTAAPEPGRWIRLTSFLAFVSSAACLWNRSAGTRVRGLPGPENASRSPSPIGKFPRQ